MKDVSRLIAFREDDGISGFTFGSQERGVYSNGDVLLLADY